MTKGPPRTRPAAAKRKGTPRTRPAAAKKGDELSGEVALRAHIDPTGLTVAGKSRFLAATDMLLGGLIGIPAAYVEGIRARLEIKSSIRLEHIQAQGRAIGLLKNMDDTGRVTAQRLIAEETRKQINREAVWVEMDESVRALPPPSPREPQDDSRELEEDWINIFASYADRASSERLRQLWGRILAGEIRKPGSFAPSTLRVISEMDTEIAAAFQEVARLRIAGGSCLLRADPLENEVLIKWTFLEEVGLLQDVNGGLTMAFSKLTEQIPLMTESYYLRIIVTDANPNLSIPFVKITRAGQQIAAILPWDELEALRQVARRITEKGAGFELGRITNRQPGGLYTPKVIERS
jgi:hypothetical protein